MPNLKDKEAIEYLSMNIAANMFGLGFAGALGNKNLYDYETFTQGNYYGGESAQGLCW